jgi:hypothetical protein
MENIKNSRFSNQMEGEFAVFYCEIKICSLSGLQP